MTASTSPPAPAAPPPLLTLDAVTMAATANLIAHFESYLGVARWDVNAYRVGFGSDTFGAAQSKVVKGESESRKDALDNLMQRVPQFLNVVIGQVGPDLFKRLGVNTRAALGSLAYNYGRVPANVVDAVLNHPTTVADAIRSCGKDNHGINQWRRDGEAACVSLDGGQY